MAPKKHKTRRIINTFNINLKISWSVKSLVTKPLSSAGASSPKATGIYNGKNANYTISQHTAMKFVVNSNQIWYVL